MSLSIRPAVADDCSTLVSFNQALAESTEGKVLDAERLSAGIRSVLADLSRGRYLVAEWDGRPAGCLMLTREWSDWRNAWFWWIQSVYVAESARRKGVYGALHERVVSEAKDAGDVCGLRLNVEHHNAGAKATYRSVGMGPGPYELYEVEIAVAL
ncbi:MAG: GNAT superfamily N-acetyltransferase [Pseudohongiellaceae bacterium]|jgi:GNAT superfamily N-acetyltransferase